MANLSSASAFSGGGAPVAPPTTFAPPVPAIYASPVQVPGYAAPAPVVTAAPPLSPAPPGFAVLSYPADPYGPYATATHATATYATTAGGPTYAPAVMAVPAPAGPASVTLCCPHCRKVSSRIGGPLKPAEEAESAEKSGTALDASTPCDSRPAVEQWRQAKGKLVDSFRKVADLVGNAENEKNHALLSEAIHATFACNMCHIQQQQQMQHQLQQQLQQQQMQQQQMQQQQQEQLNRQGTFGLHRFGSFGADPSAQPPANSHSQSEASPQQPLVTKQEAEANAESGAAESAGRSKEAAPGPLSQADQLVKAEQKWIELHQQAVKVDGLLQRQGSEELCKQVQTDLAEQVFLLRTLTEIRANYGPEILQPMAPAQFAPVPLSYDFEVVGSSPSSLAYRCMCCGQEFLIPAAIQEKMKIMQGMRTRLRIFRDRHYIAAEHYQKLYFRCAIPGIAIAGILGVLSALGEGDLPDLDRRVLLATLGAANTGMVSLTSLFGFQSKAETHNQASKMYEALLTSLEYGVDYYLGFAQSGGVTKGDSDSMDYDDIDKSLSSFIQETEKRTKDLSGTVPIVPAWAKEKVGEQHQKTGGLQKRQKELASSMGGVCIALSLVTAAFCALLLFHIYPTQVVTRGLSLIKALQDPFKGGLALAVAFMFCIVCYCFFCSKRGTGARKGSRAGPPGGYQPMAAVSAGYEPMGSYQEGLMVQSYGAYQPFPSFQEQPTLPGYGYVPMDGNALDSALQSAWSNFDAPQSEQQSQIIVGRPHGKKGSLNPKSGDACRESTQAATSPSNRSPLALSLTGSTRRQQLAIQDVP